MWFFYLLLNECVAFLTFISMQIKDTHDSFLFIFLGLVSKDWVITFPSLKRNEGNEEEQNKDSNLTELELNEWLGSGGKEGGTEWKEKHAFHSFFITFVFCLSIHSSSYTTT